MCRAWSPVGKTEGKGSNKITCDALHRREGGAKMQVVEAPTLHASKGAQGKGCKDGA